MSRPGTERAARDLQVVREPAQSGTRRLYKSPLFIESIGLGRSSVMSEVSSSADPVVLAKRRATGEAFSALFREGMALVEMTAAYLDGPGRKEAKTLDRSAALAYATESMRLTTRLMQVASWLLLHRAVNEGEMSLAQANQEKAKVKLAVGEAADERTIALLPQ